MKKIFLPIILIMVAISFLLLRSLFFTGKKEEPKKEEETITETIAVADDESQKETIEEKEERPEQEGLYRMLDFDRRLILSVGQQDDYLCSIFTLAYARAILDEDYQADPYAYFDGEGAVWRWADFEDIAHTDPLDIVLKRAYDEIDRGRPVILYVSGNYGTSVGAADPDRVSGEHFVLLIGYRLGADYDDLRASDFYTADPSGGYCYLNGPCVPWVILSDDAPEYMSGEYALFTDSDPAKHVKTCVAAADTARWDADLTKPIQPNYAGQ